MKDTPTLWLLIGAMACGGSAPDPIDTGSQCTAGGDSSIGVIGTITFARLDETGLTQGFDLDGFQTQAGDTSGCGVPDHVALNGDPGIDNSMASLIPLLELTEASAVEDILADGIRSGDLLLMIELEHIQSLSHDPCVDLSLSHGVGTPLLSTMNEILPGQTFARNLEIPRQTIYDLEMMCGEVQGSPIELDLPFRILGVELDVHLHRGQIAAQLHDDGRITGTIGAGLEVDYLLEVAQHPNVNPEIATLLESLLDMHADLDLDGDGVCELISTSLNFEATLAYLIDGSDADEDSDSRRLSSEPGLGSVTPEAPDSAAELLRSPGESARGLPETEPPEFEMQCSLDP